MESRQQKKFWPWIIIGGFGLLIVLAAIVAVGLGTNETPTGSQMANAAQTAGKGPAHGNDPQNRRTAGPARLGRG